MAETPQKSTGTNGLAIAAFVLSLVGLGIIGLILGIVALSQIKKTGEGGKGLAIAGIIIGALSVVAGIIVIIWFVWFASAVTNTFIQTPTIYNDLFQNLEIKYNY
ncbi:MAG: DUF4190 domain-containing protein [Parcubacteria group bacterium]